MCVGAAQDATVQHACGGYVRAIGRFARNLVDAIGAWNAGAYDFEIAFWCV